MTILVCGPRSYFADDVEACCSFCGATVYHRPHAPKAAKRMCIPCSLPHMKLDTKVVVTRRTASEVQLYFAAKGHRA